MSSSRELLLRFAVVLLMLSPMLAQAQVRYKWRDANGQTHYADTLTSDALARGYEIVNSQGIVVKRVARPLTAEERVAAAKEAERVRVKREAEEARKRNDRQLLAAYPTEADLVSAHRMHLDQLDQVIRAGVGGMQTQESTLAELLGRADELQHRGQKVPKKLADQISELRVQIDQQRNFQANRQRDRDQVVARQVVQLARYRELTSQRNGNP